MYSLCVLSQIEDLGEHVMLKQKKQNSLLLYSKAPDTEKNVCTYTIFFQNWVTVNLQFLKMSLLTLNKTTLNVLTFFTITFLFFY